MGIDKSFQIDNSVFLWDVATRQSVLRLRPHFNVVRTVAFSPDGTRLVTGSVDNTARVRSAFASQLADRAGAQTGATDAEQLERYKAHYWSRFLTANAGLLSAPAGMAPRTGRRVETEVVGEFNVAIEREWKTRPLRLIPARDPAAGPQQIDLSEIYNAALDEASPPTTSLDDLGQSLSSFPAGLSSLAGILFDARGEIQLARSAANWSQYPKQVRIPVRRLFRQIHVLHSVACSGREGSVVAEYRLRYTDGGEQALEVRYGRDLRDWWDSTAPSAPGEHPQVAWSGPRWAAASTPENVQLFKTTYANPRPETEVVHIDFISRMTQSAPLLVAMTVE
jgi:hypothetical protein